MISLTVFECLFRSEFRILFLGFLQVLELKYMFLELLLLRFVVDSWYLFTGSLCFILLFRFGVDLRLLFAESLCCLLMFRSVIHSWILFTE